jgi:hypothetical protein
MQSINFLKQAILIFFLDALCSSDSSLIKSTLLYNITFDNPPSAAELHGGTEYLDQNRYLVAQHELT